MTYKVSSSKMLDLEITAKALFVGASIQLVAQSSLILGERLRSAYYDESPALAMALVLSALTLTVIYVFERRSARYLWSIASSGRVDLLLAAVAGACAAMALFATVGLKDVLQRSDHALTALLLAVVCVAMGAALLRERRKLAVTPNPESIAFLSDNEVDQYDLDVLNVRKNATGFAAIVANESARGAMVFGVDGPWGTGKSTFINFAQKIWNSDDRIIVFRFEPLKFGAEKDLVRSFIQELSGELRSRFFAPELRPLASRYARMLKADPSLSLPGLRLSINSDGSTIDEIISDVSDSLARRGIRVIAVVDDLDRIDHETVKRVLFMVRRSMLASNITYVLVYDTERLISRSGDEATREYLEKFVNAKISLFVDLEALGRFLREGWKLSLPPEQSQQSTRIFGLQSILSELASILESESGGHYVGMVGNIRKIKRLINAMLLIGMESVELNQTDFSRRDLIHLFILSLNHPGVFREIYKNEAETRSGIFSVYGEYKSSTWVYRNHDGFSSYLGALDSDAKYLVGQLFDVKATAVNDGGLTPEQLRSRACFNSVGRRNLSAYLGLIVRLIVPDPMETMAVYESLLSKMRDKGGIRSTLLDSGMATDYASQVKLWSAFAASHSSFSIEARLEAIEVMIELLPLYSSDEKSIPSPRSAVVYSLATTINAAFGDIAVHNPRSAQAVRQMRDLVLGGTTSPGVLRRLGDESRGTLGVHDMMLLRLLCCPDRGNQLNNLHSALLGEKNRMLASTQRSILAIDAVREASQIAFGVFDDAYIRNRRNFVIESTRKADGPDTDSSDGEAGAYRVDGFVIYQLANSYPPSGSGVGCGYFDRSGDGDGGGISAAMNSYMFGHCFAPTRRRNMLAFADFCLANFSRDYFDDGGPIPTQQSLEQGLDAKCFGDFWRSHHDEFKKAGLESIDRTIVTTNYTASYFADLAGVWQVLDDAYLKTEQSDFVEGDDELKDDEHPAPIH